MKTYETGPVWYRSFQAKTKNDNTQHCKEQVLIGSGHIHSKADSTKTYEPGPPALKDFYNML